MSMLTGSTSDFSPAENPVASHFCIGIPLVHSHKHWEINGFHIHFQVKLTVNKTNIPLTSKNTEVTQILHRHYSIAQ